MEEKAKTQERFQKLKRFYSNKINSWPKKLSFWVLIVVFFIFLLPLCIGGALTYIFLKVKTEYAWIKVGLIILVSITVIITIGIEVSWTKTLLGMNTSPDLVISVPETETIKVKGVDTIEVSGKVKPRGSAIEINGDKVEVTGDGSFMKEVSIIKGKNEIKVVGKHGSGTTEKTIIVYRELTEKELAEEKRIEEERKARAEEERIVREEARKKAEEEAQAREKKAEEEIRAEEEKKKQELADTFCKTRSKQYARYINLNDFSKMLEKGNATIHNVYNQPPSRASCERIAEQCLKRWPEEDCKNMAERKIWIGMEANQLVLSWRIPQDKNDTVGIWGISTQWVFGDFGPYVYLDGDSKSDLVVTSWQN